MVPTMPDADGSASGTILLTDSSFGMKKPILTIQEIPFDHPDSRYMFEPATQVASRIKSAEEAMPSLRSIVNV